MKTPHVLTHEAIVEFCKSKRRPFFLGELSNAINWCADHTQQFVDHYVHIGSMREATIEEKLDMGFFNGKNSVYVWV
jgi:hypothetical protein